MSVYDCVFHKRAAFQRKHHATPSILYIDSESLDDLKEQASDYSRLTVSGEYLECFGMRVIEVVTKDYHINVATNE